MDPITRTQYQNLWSEDRDRQNAAFNFILQATESPVDWAYDVWDEVAAMLRHKDNHNRAIAAQVLSSLAKSDPDFRMKKDFGALLNVTRDERFVTARHALQSLWQIGLVGDARRQLVVDGLEARFQACGGEKNGTLIRYDILQGLRSLYDATQDESIRVKALELIETEADLKYRKKYAALWRVKEKGQSDFPTGIGAPARRALEGAGYTRLEQLAGQREADLLRLHGFGPKALRILRAALAEKGLSFKGG